jgi:hypothetical protein
MGVRNADARIRRQDTCGSKQLNHKRSYPVAGFGAALGHSVLGKPGGCNEGPTKPSIN